MRKNDMSSIRCSYLTQKQWSKQVTAITQKTYGVISSSIRRLYDVDKSRFDREMGDESKIIAKMAITLLWCEC